ncbi:MAG: hypothetical protein ACLFTZ_06140, partial [Acholeplasmataceae bacterium]
MLDALYFQTADSVAMILDNVETIAEYDFSDLTTEQEDTIVNFMILIEEMFSDMSFSSEDVMPQ